jgi:hypothetical protein
VNIDGEQVAHSSSYAYLPSNDWILDYKEMIEWLKS